MITVNVDIDIDRPPLEVWSFLSDASNNTKWQGGMRRCEWTSSPPIALGSTYEQEATFMGRTVHSVFEVTDYRPPRSITITSTEGTFPIEVTRSVDPLDDASCRVRARVQGGPTGSGRFFDPLTQLLVKRSVKRDYRRLRNLLEQG
jgi:uncharacterized protein YndB with AHSA1/START domain